MLTLVHESAVIAPGPGHREIYVWRDEAGATVARAFAHGDCRWITWRGLGTFTFLLGSSTVHARPEPGVDFATTVTSAFARVLQPIILQALGQQSLHASAVLGADGVLAFCGVSHSGKSTLAYALGHEGYCQIADDALVIEPSGDLVYARPLPFAPSLRERSLRHFGDRDNDCAAAPTAVIRAPLKLVFVLSQDASLETPQHRRVSPVQAFSALVTHARCFDDTDPSNTRQLVDVYLRVAEVVPVFELRYPPDFDRLPALVDSVKQIAADSGGVRSHCPPLSGVR